MRGIFMKLLIADDETLIREAILARLKKGNYAFDEIFLAADGLEAWDIARRERPESSSLTYRWTA